MRIAILTRPKDPCSLNIYYDNMIGELSDLGVEIIPFLESNQIPLGCDLIWEPALAMRRISKIFKNSYAPIVGTMHGVKAFSLPIRELTNGLIDELYLRWLKKALIHDWDWFKKKVSAIISVSRYSAEEVINAFDLSPNIVHSVYHGINHNVFNIKDKKQFDSKPYLLHISTCYNPIKNLERIIAAYKQIYKSIPGFDCPDFIIVLPNYKKNINVRGVKLIKKTLSQNEIADLYRGAMALIFPSLRETFGMPIIEAMACGCPVITSNVTACREVAGNAALLVDPYSIINIAQNIKFLIENKSIRQDLCQKGLIHAKQFTWRKAAEETLAIFQSIIYEK